MQVIRINTMISYYLEWIISSVSSFGQTAVMLGFLSGCSSNHQRVTNLNRNALII